MDKTAGMSGRATARDAILQAFADIILENGYDKARVLDVVARSGVARSTFYEHFQSKEDLLRESMRGAFETLAQLAEPSCDLARLASALDHFMQHRVLAKSLMANPGTDTLIDLLAEMLAERSRTVRSAIAVRAVAGAQMAALSSWLDGKDTRSAADLSETLHAISVALLTHPLP